MTNILYLGAIANSFVNTDQQRSLVYEGVHPREFLEVGQQVTLPDGYRAPIAGFVNPNEALIDLDGNTVRVPVRAIA